MASHGDILAAVKPIWEASSLAGRFGGRVYRDEAPANSAYPYVVIKELPSERAARSNAAEYWRGEIQFNAHDRTAELCDGHVTAIGSVLDPITVPDAIGLLGFDRMGEETLRLDLQNYAGIIRYQTSRRKPRED